MNGYKKLKLWLRFTYLVLLCGCVSRGNVEKSPGFSKSDHQTYSWINLRPAQSNDGYRATAFADLSVQNEVNAQLQSWGWREVDQNPDVYVGYDILVDKSTSVQRDPVYSEPFIRYYFNRFRGRWTPVYYPSYFLGYDSYSVPVKDITLSILLMDAENDKKLWQGWTSREMSRSDMLSSKDIRHCVRSIFKAA